VIMVWALASGRRRAEARRGREPRQRLEIA